MSQNRPILDPFWACSKGQLAIQARVGAKTRDLGLGPKYGHFDPFWVILGHVPKGVILRELFDK